MKEHIFLRNISKFNIELLTNISLKDYTSFKVGGNADFIVKPKACTDIANAVKSAIDANIDYCIIGNGSNLLVSDNGYRGVVILSEKINKIHIEDEGIIICEAGVQVAKLCNFALNHSLTGLEFAFGIPGSVGGGIYMNAGAYGGEFKDSLISCDYIDENGEIKTLKGENMQLSYRKSFFTDKKLFILSGKFKLEKGDKAEISSRMNNYLSKRKEKQPMELPSCGSTFKRPANGYASALIDECGLKCYTVGGAQVSSKHAGFIVNVDNASCEDILAVIEHVKAIVLKEKGIELECEVKYLGF